MRLVYLSPVPWASFAQRPHKFVEWFHGRTGGRVLWVDPYPTRLPQISDLGRLSDRLRGDRGCQTEAMPGWLSVLSPRALPIEPLLGSGLLNRHLWGGTLRAIDRFFMDACGLVVAAKPSELALQVTRRYPSARSVYDAMDDFPAFYDGLARRAMESRERRLAKCVGGISVSSTALALRFSEHGDKLLLARNACALDSLPNVEHLQRSTGRLVLGYVGTIGKWFDWAAVLHIAQQCPQANVRLIGPVYEAPPGPLLRNIELLPACSHHVAIAEMRGFTAGLIPFRRTDLTRSVDPIKYYEYRALGLPVITSRFGEMEFRTNEPGVFTLDEQGDNVRDIVAMAKEYVMSPDEIRIFRQHNSWEARFDALQLVT